MPHRMKVWYFRHVMRNPDAGKPGGAPFRTFLRITPQGVMREGERLGMETVLFVTYNSGAGEALRGRSWAARVVWWLVSALLLGLAGRDPDASDAIIVLAR